MQTATTEVRLGTVETLAKIIKCDGYGVIYHGVGGHRYCTTRGLVSNLKVTDFYRTGSTG